jgi:hypothetical protein
MSAPSVTDQLSGNSNHRGLVISEQARLVEQYCQARGVAKEFEIVCRLAEASFGPTALRVSMHVDAETGETGVTIRLAVRGKSEEKPLESYLRLIDDLVREIPSDARGLFSISLDYSS